MNQERLLNTQPEFAVYEAQQRGPSHRAFVRRFPFEVFYQFDDKLVVVHLVFHTSQDPGKWRERLGTL